MRSYWRTMIKGVVLMLGLALVSAVGAAEESTKPVVSIFYSLNTPMINPEAPPPFVGVLDGLGLRLGSPNAEPGATLDWKHLSRYNMIIITTPPEGDFTALLQRYLARGGASSSSGSSRWTVTRIMTR